MPSAKSVRLPDPQGHAYMMGQNEAFYTATHTLEKKNNR